MGTADGSGYIPPKPPPKKKKPRSTPAPTTSYADDRRTPAPTYTKPVSSPPPSYSTLSTPQDTSSTLGWNPLGTPKPKEPKEPTSFLDFIQNTAKKMEPTAEPGGLAELLQTPLSGKKPTPEVGSDPVGEDGLTDGMKKFLESLREDKDLAPKGYTPGAEKLGSNEFAWVPERFKTRKNGKLKQHWDQDFIESALSDLSTQSNVNFFLNGLMEKQFQDRENWLLTKNERKYGHIKDVLDNASQAAFEGDYDYLREKLDKNPNLFETSSYRSKFGVTPESIWKAWEEQRGSLSMEQREDARYRIDMMMRHYEKLRSGKFFSYQQTSNLVDKAIKKYEEKYNESVDFGLNSYDDERAAAAKAAGPAIPHDNISNEDQDLIDQVGSELDPRRSEYWADTLGLSAKKGRKRDRRSVEKARHEAMSTLGTHNLPSVKQMLAYKVANGDLDPKDESAVEDMIERLRNPNHPDTRAMYVAFTMNRNPEFDAEGKGLDYINDPVVQYQKRMEEFAQADQEAALDRDLNAVSGPIDLVADSFHYAPMGSTLEGVSSTTHEQGMNQLGWTFDKLLRLNYGVAGMANAWYGLDKDHKSRSWNDFVDPTALVTGQGAIGSLDDIVRDPSGLAQVLNAGYEQVFRGSSLPGIEKDIVPITFSQVVANNALRDSEENFYDADWYQHVSGFALDVAFDPLNYIGVGLIDDTLKVPTRIAKALRQGEEAGEATTDVMNFLRRIEAPNASPIAEKAYRVDQAIRRIGDDVSGNEYADDLDIWDGDFNGRIVNEYDHDAVLRNITNQMDDLRVQEVKLKNDVGVQSLHDELSEILDTNATLAFSASTDLRINRLMQRTTTTGKYNGVDYVNPGGRFWRDFIDPLESSAKSRGFSTTEYAPTTIGKAAQQAEADLNRLLDDIDAGKLNAGDPAVAHKKAQLEKRLDDAYEVDPATGKPSIQNVAKTEEFLKAGAPGFNRTFDPVKAFAEAAGTTREEFLRTFSEQDVYDALLKGPRMLTESDEAAAAQFLDATERIREAKVQLDAPGISAPKRAAAQKALQIGYTLHSNITAAGAMRYLDVLQDMRRGGHSAYNWEAAGKYADLENLDRSLVDELEKYTDIDEVGGNYIGSQSMDLEDFTFEGENFAGKTVADILGDERGFTSTPAKLEAARAEIKAQMQELLPLMAETKEITGFPPAQAYQIDRMLPQDSMFRKADGSIDPEEVEAALSLDVKSHKVSYTKPADAKPTDVAFLDLVRDTVQYEYFGAYRAEKTAVVKKNLGDTPSTNGAGPRETRLGPRPTAASVRAELPELSGRLGKGETPQVRESTVSSPEGWRHTDEDIVIDKATGAKSVEQNLARTGGKRSKGQRTWEQIVKERQREWDRRVARAKELDAAEARQVSTKFKVSGKEQELITQKAYKRSVDGVLKSLESGTIKKIPGNMRLSINDEASKLIKTIQLQHRADDIRLQIAEINARESKNLDLLKDIQHKREALLKQKKEHLAEVERARQVAHETKKNMTRIVKEEHALQIGSMPPRATGRMLQFRIMGMRKNMQFSNNLFRGAEKAAELIPAKMRENFANYFVRPTKQLDSREAIMFRAQWESKTPVIIKAHLERLSHRMRDIHETDRRAMLKAYRDGVDYEGPQMQLFDDAMEEVREVESIWNGHHEFYWFRANRSADNPTPLSTYEIAHFLPQEYKPNLRVLHRAQNQDGAITAQGLIEAIKANPNNKVQDLLDPFRLSWTMRLAADQARQLKALKHSMEQTFGVQVGTGARARVLRRLKDQHGWSTVKGLSDDFLFPPEAHNDIKKLLEFTEPGEAQNQFSRMADQALGYWKQSMTIYNPGYYTRNGIGEIMSSWLDGVNHPKWYRMAYRVHKYQKGEGKDLAALVERWSALDGKIPVDVAKGGELLFKLKGGQKVTLDDALRAYANMGLKSTFANTDLGRGVRGLAGSSLSDSKTKKALNKVNERVHDAGEGFEDYLRMAHFLHAMQHSNKGTIHQAAMYAAERVRRSHFDYTDFSTFEKSVMLRAFPFYKWTRRGAPLMLAHLFMTPGKMGVLPKAMDTMSGLGLDPVGAFTDDPVMSTKDVHDDKNGHLPDYQGIAPGWVRDLFAYQISPSEDDEYANYFRVQTPQVDGLNAVLGLTPGTGNEGLGAILGDSAAYPLLNPAVKAGAELGMNQSLDPDFSQYPIYGGEYNEELQGLNPLESIAAYAARSVSPPLGFLAKLSKNGNLGPLSMGEGDDYRREHGYDPQRDIASFATGLGFYQAKPGAVPPPVSSPAVGQYELSDIPEIRGRKAAGEYVPEGKDSPSGDYSISDIVKAYGESGGSGWTDYGNNGWINYGNNGGYNGYQNYSSASYSSYPTVNSGSGLAFWDLIQRLKAMVDQGQVYDG